MANDARDEFRSFPSTHWSFVDEAAAGSDEGARKALGELVLRYLPALRAHLVLRKRLSRDMAEELLLSFVAQKVVEEELVAKADRQRGKFRTFMLTALDRYVANRLRDAKAEKRHPSGRKVVSLTDELHEAAASENPATAFDTAWAREVISQCLARMEAECRDSGRPDVWGVFECRLLSPLLGGDAPEPYDALVKRFEFNSPTQAANVLITAKRMFARTIRAVVGEYVADEQEVEEEIADLREILSGSCA